MRRFLLPAFLALLMCTSAFGQVRVRWMSDTLYQNGAGPAGSMQITVSGLDSGQFLSPEFWINAPSANTCDIVTWMGCMGATFNGLRNGDVVGFAPANPFASNSFIPLVQFESRFWAEGWHSAMFSVGHPDANGNFIQDSLVSVPRAFYFKRSAPIPVSDYRIFPNQFDMNAPMLVEAAGPRNVTTTYWRSSMSLLDVTRRGLWNGTSAGTTFGMSATGPNSGVFDVGAHPLGVYDVLVRTIAGCEYFPAGITVGTSQTPGVIRGRVYADRVANCRYDTADRLAPMTLVQAQDSIGNRYFGMTDFDGMYTIRAPHSRYDVRMITRSGLPARGCRASQSAETNTAFPSVMLSAFFDSARAGDAGVSLMNGVLRPGMQTRIWATSEFLGDFNFQSRFVLELDSLTSYVPDPSNPVDSVVGRKVYLKQVSGSTSSVQYRYQYVTVSLPPDGSLISRTVHFKVSRIGAPDANPANDTTSTVATIAGSQDPNDKQVSPEFRRPGVEGDLTYTIRFQNTGTDTAFYVAVRDTLSPLLDLSTLHGFASTHKAQYRLTGRVLEARFPFINLVDSNRNEPASHGQFSFKIKPVAGLALGQQIENKADIYFDYNAPVRTNTATFQVQQPAALVAARPEVMQWVPNPAMDRAELHMTAVPAGKLLAVDAAGKTHTMTYERTETGILIVLSSLAPGVYSFRFEGGAAVGRLVVAN